MEANKPLLYVTRASSAGKQRTNAVKIYWSIDQITVVYEPLSRCSSGDNVKSG